MQSNALSREVTNHASESRCSSPARQSRRLAVVEGISLWLAVLLFFALQSVVAEASVGGFLNEPDTAEAHHYVWHHFHPQGLDFPQDEGATVDRAGWLAR